MQCVDFQRRLNRLLDERQRPEDDAALQAHSMACPGCRDSMAGQGRLRELMAQGIAPLSTNFTRRIVSRSMREPRLGRRKKWIAAAIFATAATLVIAVLPLARRPTFPTAFRVARFTSETPGTHSAARRPRTGSGTIAVWQPQSQRAVIISQPTLSADNTAESEDFRQLIRVLLANLPDVPNAQLEPIDRIAGGFKPLASTLSAALGAIRRTIPVGREPDPGEPQAVVPGWNCDTSVG